MKTLKIFALLAIAVVPASAARGTQITLENANATFSQVSFPVTETIDTIKSGFNGWAISPNEDNQTAIYQTATNVGGTGGAAFTFTLYNDFGPSEILGDFRISVTTDARGSFDQTAGDVTANWTELTPTYANALGTGAPIALTIEPDNSILASSSGTPNTSDFTVTATTALTGITGIRLEALTDPSLPAHGSPTIHGPGLESNGNFVLSEFVVNATPITAVPEPAAFWLLAAGGAVAAVCRARRSRYSRLLG